MRFLRSNTYFLLPHRIKFQSSLNLKSLYFKQRKNFNSQEERSDSENEESYEDNSVKYFVPKNSMVFKDDLSAFFVFPDHAKIRKMFFAILVAFGYGAYKSGEKLYNFSERSFFGALFYTIFGIICVRYTRTALNQGASLVNKMSLTRDGTSVILERYKYGMIPETMNIDITSISLPSRESVFDKVNVGSIGIKIKVDETEFVLPKYGQILNEEVLRAVVRGYYIQIDESKIIYN